MKTKQLSQEEADAELKKLRMKPDVFPSFEKTFTCEMDRIKANERIWALPQLEREYYHVYVEEGMPYLLIGLHPRHLNLSSIARVAEKPGRMGSCCLKHFLEHTVLPMCWKHERAYICSTASTIGGRDLFRNLKKDLPPGVQTIEIEEQEFLETIWRVTIHLDEAYLKGQK